MGIAAAEGLPSHVQVVELQPGAVDRPGLFRPEADVHALQHLHGQSQIRGESGRFGAEGARCTHSPR